MDTLPAIAASYGSSLDEEARILENKFGDGYTQTAADGINNIDATLPMKWEWITSAEADTLIAFFRAKAGTTPFKYKIPTEPAAWVWKCKKWSRDTDKCGLTSVNATFERRFDLG
ncbi:MAG: phage tail protein [Syntrophobacteraceae bacterium]